MQRESEEGGIAVVQIFDSRFTPPSAVWRLGLSVLDTCSDAKYGLRLFFTLTNLSLVTQILV